MRALRGAYERLAGRDDWRALVLTRPAEPGTSGIRSALHAAERLRIPAVPQVLAHLRAEPDDGYCWYTAIRLAGDADTAGQVVAALQAVLPMDGLLNGPGTDLGFGPEYEHERLLESVTSGLDRHPGVGLPLIRAALGNRVVRLRWGALRTLTEWPAVPEEALAWVRAAAGIEPHPGLRGTAGVRRDRW